MLSVTENLLVLVLIVGGTQIFLMSLNRFWPWQKRRDHNDLVGWQLSIVGTTYAVILGFMLYTVWTNYGQADQNVDAEANALVNIYRLADGLPAEQREQLKVLTRSYADEVVRDEWPAMDANEVPRGSMPMIGAMWKLLLSGEAASRTESTAEDHALSQLSALAANRRMRLLQSASVLPPVLWCVLVIGGIVTISSACMFGTPNGTLHTLQVSAFSLLLGLVLIAIADIYRPFQGSVRVSSAAFARAQQMMKDE